MSPDAVGEPAERGRREERRQEHVAVDRAGGGEIESVHVLEILDRERAAEREDHRVPQCAEPEQVPVGRPNRPHVGVASRAARRPHPRAGPRRGRDRGASRCRRRERQRREERGDEQRRLPAVGVGARHPGRRQVDRECAGAADRDRSAIANPRFRPEKYFTMAAIVQILKVSAPMPNRNRPAAMPGNPVPSAVRSAPAKQIGAGPRTACARRRGDPPAARRTAGSRCSAGCRARSAGRSACPLNPRSRTSRSATGPIES